MAFDWLKNKGEKEVRVFLKNARQKGDREAEEAGLRRLFEIGGAELEDPLAKDVMGAILTLENLRGRRLSRTRRMLDNRGMEASVARLVVRDKPSDGFTWLVEAGCWDQTFEAIALKHKKRFELSVIEAAQRRLREHELV